MAIPIWQEGTDVRQEERAEPAQRLPGRPATVWQHVAECPVTDLARPREAPRPESVEEVARWEGPDGVSDRAPDQAANLTSEVHKDNQWIFEHGTAHTIPPPFTRDGGEGFVSPTFIAIDHRVDDAQAARIHQAPHTWLSDGTVQEQLSRRTLRQPQGVIAAQEIFGPEATGGYYVESVPGFGSADDFEAHRWVLVTEPRDGQSEPNVTTVPYGKKLRRIRSKLRRRAARRSGR